MLKSPQRQRGESSTAMSMLMCMTKRSYCKLFVSSPFKCRLHSIADVGDKVLRFILSSHVGHWKWSAEMVVCTQTQFFSHKSFFLLIETKHKWVFGSKFYWRGRESVSAWPRDALRTEGSIYCASKWPLFLFIFYCVTKKCNLSAQGQPWHKQSCLAPQPLGEEANNFLSCFIQTLQL